MGEFNKLKFLKKELIELKGDGFSERKLIDKMIEDEVLNLSLGVSNKKIIPVFSYLLTTMNLKSLFYFRKCVNFIDADTISLNEKVITKRRREGACVFFFIFLIFSWMLISADVETAELKWFYTVIIVLLIPLVIWYFEKLPSKYEIKDVKEILNSIDKEKYYEYKIKHFSDYIDKSTSPNEREVPTKNLNQ
ncbi:TPA: hypothetical protein ACS72U_000838 [Providencia alcalifaciens]